MSGVYEGDTDESRVTATIDDPPLIGGNLVKHLDALRQQMTDAAENLEFEEAARIRDEIKRLETVELTIADDPLARQSSIEQAVEANVVSKSRSIAGRAGKKPNRRRRKSYHKKKTLGRPATAKQA